MRISRLALTFPLALSLALTACNQAGNESPTASPETLEVSPESKAEVFDKEVLAIKARYKDPKMIEAALRALNTRLGISLPPGMEPDPIEAQKGGKFNALAKTSAVSAYWHSKSMNLGYQFANTLVINVANGQTLSASGSKLEAGLDPVLLGFYFTYQFPNVPAAYKLQLVGYSDDKSATDFNSYFSWKNTTGSTKQVRLVLFGYPGTHGKSSLYIALSNGGAPTATQTKKLWVSGMATFDNFQPPPPEAGCVGPNQSKMEFKKYYSANIKSTLIAVNASTWRGGFIYESSYSITLDEVLPPGGYNLLLAYVEGNSNPQPDPFLGSNPAAYYGDNLFHAYQFDRYDCTNPDW